MARRGQLLRAINSFIQMPWGRLMTVLAVIGVAIWLGGKYTRCRSVVRYNNDEAEFAYKQLRCNAIDNHNFPSIRQDCKKYQAHLHDDFQDDLWWTCFANTFFFYRTWSGMLSTGVLLAVIWWNWLRQPQMADQRPMFIFRSEPKIELYDSDDDRSPERPAIRYRTYERLPNRPPLRLPRIHSSDDDD